MNYTPQERALLKRIGISVKERRLKIFGARSCGRSVAELSREAGVTKPMVKKIEDGEVNTSIVLLKRIAEALQCEPGDLLG
jgi:DNA-binding Xre family transcriptional regulator